MHSASFILIFSVSYKLGDYRYAYVRTDSRKQKNITDNSMRDSLVDFAYGFYSSHGSIVVNGGLIVDKGTTRTNRSMVIFPRR